MNKVYKFKLFSKKLAIFKHFSSPEPLGARGELIIYQSSRRPSVIHHFKGLLLRTAGPIKAKFHVEHPWAGGTKVYINRPGHMNEMAAMLIYGKPLTIFFSRTNKSYDFETWHAASENQCQ